MKRSVSMLAALVLISFTFSHSISAQKGGHQGTARLDLVEATVPELLKALQTKLITSEQLVEMYLARIAAYDDAGTAAQCVPDPESRMRWPRRARSMRRGIPGIARSPLYGIPVLLKDNVNTADMPTTAGSVALEGSIPPDDAFITNKLRDAGAIILGKATLTEFANFLTNGMPTGYSSLGGYGFNPYDPRELPGGDGRAGAGNRRVELGFGHRGGCESRRRGGRHRNIRIDPESGEREHGCRHQADRGFDQPRRHHSDYRRSGHRRPDHPHGDRCRDPARRAGRSRSE